MAGTYRADLEGGHGNGRHGFEYPINWAEHPDGTYQIRAYGIGAEDNPELAGSPKTYVNTSAAATPAGVLDSVSESSISGWAWRSDIPNTPIDVHVYLTHIESGEQWGIPLTANRYRSDLDGEYGNGCHGFMLPVDWRDYPNGTYRINAYGIGLNGNNNKELYLSPMTYVNSGWSTVNLEIDKTYSADFNAIAGTHSYKFVAPTKGAYIIRSYGPVDTYGKVTLTNDEIYTNDDRKINDYNFEICVILDVGEVLKVEVSEMIKKENSTAYRIRAHRAVAQIYTFSYEDGLDTRRDYVVPEKILERMGYLVHVNVNQSANHILGNYDINRKRINCDVLFFSGHGIKGNQAKLEFIDKTYLSTSDYFEMDKNALSFWSACYSSYNGGFVEKSNFVGAKGTIGWNIEIDDDTAHVWNEAFFTAMAIENSNKIHQGIRSAMAAVGSKNIWINYNTTDFEGESSTFRPVNYTGEETTSSSSLISLKEWFEGEKEQYRFVEYPLKGGGIRYIKVINEMLTNDYYDVYEDGEIYSSPEKITSDEVEKMNFSAAINFADQKPVTSENIAEFKNQGYTGLLKINGKIRLAKVGGVSDEMSAAIGIHFIDPPIGGEKKYEK